MGSHIKNTKKLTFSAILTALCCVIMFSGKLFGVLDMTCCMLASFLVIFAVIELGASCVTGIYIASSLLSVIIGIGFESIYFIVFFGIYPIIKTFAERAEKLVLEWCVKAICFGVIATLSSFFASAFVSEDILSRFPFAKIILFCVLIAFFVIYDIVLTRMITVYIRVLRKKFRIDRLMK